MDACQPCGFVLVLGEGCKNRNKQLSMFFQSQQAREKKILNIFQGKPSKKNLRYLLKFLIRRSRQIFFSSHADWERAFVPIF